VTRDYFLQIFVILLPVRSRRLSAAAAAGLLAVSSMQISDTARMRWYETPIVGLEP
jgi:hypothetical protein